jgi:hypothetical protein
MSSASEIKQAYGGVAVKPAGQRPVVTTDTKLQSQATVHDVKFRAFWRVLNQIAWSRTNSTPYNIHGVVDNYNQLIIIKCTHASVAMCDHGTETAN